MGLMSVLKLKKDRLRSEWFGLWSKLAELDDKHLSRESVRKIDISHRSLSLSDIHSVMRDDVGGVGVVDAEFVVEEDGDEEDENGEDDNGTDECIEEEVVKS